LVNSTGDLFQPQLCCVALYNLKAFHICL
jgi:hypothetical protein